MYRKLFRQIVFEPQNARKKTLILECAIFGRGRNRFNPELRIEAQLFRSLESRTGDDLNEYIVGLYQRRI